MTLHFNRRSEREKRKGPRINASEGAVKRRRTTSPSPPPLKGGGMKRGVKGEKEVLRYFVVILRIAVWTREVLL